MKQEHIVRPKALEEDVKTMDYKSKNIGSGHVVPNRGDDKATIFVCLYIGLFFYCQYQDSQDERITGFSTMKRLIV